MIDPEVEQKTSDIFLVYHLSIMQSVIKFLTEHIFFLNIMNESCLEIIETTQIYFLSKLQILVKIG